MSLDLGQSLEDAAPPINEHKTPSTTAGKNSEAVRHQPRLHRHSGGVNLAFFPPLLPDTGRASLFRLSSPLVRCEPY